MERVEKQKVRRPGATLPRAIPRDFLRRAPRFGLSLGFLALCAVLSFVSPVFLTPTNLLNVALQASVVAILAFGQTFVVLTSGIDLSVGSMLALCGAVMASIANQYGVAAGILLGFALGALL